MAYQNFVLLIVYIISPLTSQLRTASRKVSIKYIGPLAVYKIVDPHNYLLITLDGKLLRGLFKHESLKPAVIRTNQGNVTNLSKLKQVMSSGLLLPNEYNENRPIISNYEESGQMIKQKWTEGCS